MFQPNVGVTHHHDSGTPAEAEAWLAAATVDAAVGRLRPDYRALPLTADGLRGGPSDAVSERVLADAEDTARRQLTGQKPEELPHPAAWREAYRAFGAKPQRTRPSAEALLRRLGPDGLPRIDRITDVYNAAFILDALDPLTDDAVFAAADALTDALQAVSPDVTVHRRLFTGQG